MFVRILWMPTNEGGTHGLFERVRSDGEIRRRTPMNAENQRNLTKDGTRGPLGSQAGWSRGVALQQSPDRFTAIPSGAAELIKQLSF